MSAISDEAVEAAAKGLGLHITMGNPEDYLEWDELSEADRADVLASARAALVAALPHLLPPAVHEAYVNAQRAVAALSLDGATVGYRHGRETMQEDAVRAIREAAEEDR